MNHMVTQESDQGQACNFNLFPSLPRTTHNEWSFIQRNNHATVKQDKIK